jgi:hypothetical protein
LVEKEVQLDTALENTQSVAEGVKTVYITAVLQSEIKVHTHKIIKHKNGEKTREWLIPWSIHSVYGCRSNKPRYSPTLMEPKGALILVCSKQLATVSYLEPAESS